MSVICFAELFRQKKLLNIRLCDIALHDDLIKIHIPYSKTDIYREGQDVLSRGQTLVHVQGFYLADIFSMDQYNFK